MIEAREGRGVKHRRQGVKREHSVIGDFAAVYERLARLPGVAGVIPGRIANNPTHHPGLVLKTETATGFKLLAKTTTSIQEVFVMAEGGRRETALAGIGGMVTRPTAPRPVPPRKQPPSGAERGVGRRPWRNPGVLPEGRRNGPLVGYSLDGVGRARGGRTRPGSAPGGASIGDSVRSAALRRRLLVLRLRRSRWRRRFGVPRRLVPLPPRRR